MNYREGIGGVENRRRGISGDDGVMGHGDDERTVAVAQYGAGRRGIREILELPEKWRIER